MKLWRENIFIMKRNHTLARGFDVFVTFYELYVSTVYLFSKSHLSCRVISPRSIWVYLFGRQNCLKANKLKHSYLCLLLDWHKLRKDFTFDRIFQTISDKTVPYIDNLVNFKVELNTIVLIGLDMLQSWHIWWKRKLFRFQWI